MLWHKYSLRTLFLLLIILVSACKQDKKKEIQNSKANISNVELMLIKPQSFIDYIKVSGTILPDEKVELRPETSGRLININFEEGSKVEKGKLLIKLNDDELQAQLKKLKLQKEILVDDEKRKSELLKIKAVSQEEYDISLNKLNTLKADIDLLQAQIAKTEIYAPFNGIVGLRQVSLGDFVNSSTLITTLIKTSPVKIEFSIPEKFSSIVKNNSEIEFSISGSNELFKAKIYATEPKVDVISRTLKIRAINPNNENKLIPGSLVNIKLAVNINDSAFIIPTAAIVPELKGNKLLVVKNGKITEVFVKTGERNETQIEILDGVKAGDSIVVSGILQARIGNIVNIRKIVEF